MLSNKNILITGASSGIGRQIAIDCALNNGQTN
jgi:NAD(P)-dependent dehydrogenase (short-subunit alcohol dehydrogenase family)